MTDPVGNRLSAALAENKRLRARLETLQQRDTIPRATLVTALRERAARHEYNAACLDPDDPVTRKVHMMQDAARQVTERLADEIERGEWPRDGEGK